jgi:cell division protein FtsW (lipid II flippase)
MNRSFDHWLVLITAVLLAFGLVMVFSASAVLASLQSAGASTWGSAHALSRRR